MKVKEIEKLVNKIVEKVWELGSVFTKEELQEEYYSQIYNDTERNNTSESLQEYLELIEEFELLEELENLLIQLNTYSYK